MRLNNARFIDTVNSETLDVDPMNNYQQCFSELGMMGMEVSNSMLDGSAGTHDVGTYGSLSPAGLEAHTDRNIQPIKFGIPQALNDARFAAGMPRQIIRLTNSCGPAFTASRVISSSSSSSENFDWGDTRHTVI
eukprot:818617_1